MIIGTEVRGGEESSQEMRERERLCADDDRRNSSGRQRRGPRIVRSFLRSPRPISDDSTTMIRENRLGGTRFSLVGFFDVRFRLYMSKVDNYGNLETFRRTFCKRKKNGWR